MVNIINIKRIGDIISANYIPENDKKEVGYIELDCNTFAIIKSEITSFDKPFKVYLMHTRRALINMIKNNEIKEKYQVMWY